MTEKIGQELHRVREEQNISLEQAAAETHIRLHFLEALEMEDFDQLPSEAHVRGFLRAYAEYLGIASQSLLISLGEQEKISPKTEADSQDKQTPTVVESTGNAILIFKDLGADLRQQREMLGFSLEEVERNIHIRQHYLETLESGNLDGLPSPVQGRGMLQNYAAFLGLDTELILLRFADGLQAQLTEKRAAQPISPDTRPSRRRASLPFLRSFPGDWIIGAILIVAVIAFTIWGTIRISSLKAAPNPVETLPSIAEALQATPEGSLSEIPPPTETPLPEPVETETSTGLEGNPIVPPPVEVTQETPVPTASDAPIQVYVSVLEGLGCGLLWMEILSSRDELFPAVLILSQANFKSNYSRATGLLFKYFSTRQIWVF
jgi:cytoskeleton protein RodZ